METEDKPFNYSGGSHWCPCQELSWWRGQEESPAGKDFRENRKKKRRQQLYTTFDRLAKKGSRATGQWARGFFQRSWFACLNAEQMIEQGESNISVPLTLSPSLSQPHTHFPVHTPNLRSQSIPGTHRPQGCYAVIVFMWLFSHSVVSDSFVTPWAVARQDPQSVGPPRQEYCCGLPFPSLEDLPNPGIEPAAPALAGVFFAATREALDCLYVSQ